jgi:hypothetical protein
MVRFLLRAAIVRAIVGADDGTDDAMAGGTALAAVSGVIEAIVHGKWAARGTANAAEAVTGEAGGARCSRRICRRSVNC